MAEASGMPPSKAMYMGLSHPYGPTRSAPRSTYESSSASQLPGAVRSALTSSIGAPGGDVGTPVGGATVVVPLPTTMPVRKAAPSPVTATTASPVRAPALMAMGRLSIQPGSLTR